MPSFPFRFPLSAFRFCFAFLLGFALHLSASEPALSPTNAIVAPAVPQNRALGESELIELLTATLQQDYVKERGELELRLTQPWKSQTVPEGPMSLKVLEMPNAGVTAHFIVRFELQSEDKSLGTWQVPAHARIWREIWVAGSPLKRGDLIADANIVRARRDMLSIRSPLADFDEGDPDLHMAEPLQAGAPVLARSVKLRPIVHRGQAAEAVVQTGALNISMKVEMLEDGAMGQIVRARNPVSLRTVRGKVIAEQTILISM